jgi:hypothetical protein
VPKGDEAVLCPKPGVNDEAVGSNEERNIDEFAAVVAGSSSGTNIL